MLLLPSTLHAWFPSCHSVILLSLLPPHARPLRPQVTVISTSPRKKEEACARLGADRFIVSAAGAAGWWLEARRCGRVRAPAWSKPLAALPACRLALLSPPISPLCHPPQVSKDPEQMKAEAGTLDGIIDTVSGERWMGRGRWEVGVACTLMCLPPRPAAASSLPASTC